ncbi:hypothetical protein MSAN_01852900 [Mycena sanguinolenta]|uniref:F-box domain-containing protein n=1 Tax=Mycena sanguinolenta TaxID=230812 RepID=A0A8H7CS50_9AGAR|nr:hypothetical protein MSAN_01852900 [Mycena sanguinolenta]
MANEYEARLTADLKQRVAAILLENPGMSPEDAMREAQAALLAQAEADLFHKITDIETKNNPFRPPTTGCPINDLPPELLAHIFTLGCKLDEEESGHDEIDDMDWDEDSEGLDLADDWETDDEEGDADEEIVQSSEDVHMSSSNTRATRSGAVPPETDEEDSDDDDDEDEADDMLLPFQVLVSHVCRHWREISLGTHTLWTTIRFAGHLNAEKASAWIERANDLPLDIYIEATDLHDPQHNDPEGEQGGQQEDAQPPGAWPGPGQITSIVMAFNPATGTLTTSAHTGIPFHAGPPQPERPMELCLSLDDLKVILDLIIPRVAQWRLFEVSVNYYTYMYEILSRLAHCPGAPLLEELGLYNYEETDTNEDGEEVETFQPAHLAEAFLPFSANAPNIKHVAFWGVHIARSSSRTTPRTCGPAFASFRAMLDASPELDLLSLCYSGPTGDMEPIAIPSLHALVLCDMEKDLVIPLVAALELPALDELTVDLHGEDFTDFAEQLAKHARGQTRSLLAGLTTLKLAGLHCNNTTRDMVMAQLDGLKRLHLKCEEDEEEEQEDAWFKRLKEVKGTGVRYCPKLDSLKIEGIEGAVLKDLVIARKEAGAPFKQVFLGTLDELSKRDEQWFRANVEQFDFFDPSDDEEEEAVEVDAMDTDA